MASSFTIKQGGTLLLNCQAVQDDGTPINITGVTITSQVRDLALNLVAACVVTLTNAANGQFTLGVADTSAFPIGNLSADVCYLQNGVTLYSDTYTILVTQPVTTPP